MDHAIWLNRRKIFSADEISANFDIAAIRGYFLGGSLIRWLNANGGENYARALAELSPSDPALNDRLTEIFTGKKNDAPVHKSDDNLIRTIEILRGGVPVTGSAQNVNDSFGESSFGAGYGSFAYNFSSFSYGSFSYNFGSYRSGSFSYGSFAGSSFRRTWDWEWEWRFGSFRGGSFRYGGGSAAYNFSSYRGTYGSFGYNFGSYLSGSFMSGSFVGGSFRGRVLGSFTFDTSYGMGSYRGFPLAGSFRAVTADEYDEIMYRCLSVCPLNRFGYGIHLI